MNPYPGEDELMADRLAEPTEPAPAALATREICVPDSALAIADESQQAVSPEDGDDVSLNITGKVTRREGGHAYIAVKSINGEEVSSGAEPPSEAESMAAEGADLRKLMEQA